MTLAVMPMKGASDVAKMAASDLKGMRVNIRISVGDANSTFAETTNCFIAPRVTIASTFASRVLAKAATRLGRPRAAQTMQPMPSVSTVVSERERRSRRRRDVQRMLAPFKINLMFGRPFLGQLLFESVNSLLQNVGAVLLLSLFLLELRIFPLHVVIPRRNFVILFRPRRVGKVLFRPFQLVGQGRVGLLQLVPVAQDISRLGQCAGQAPHFSLVVSRLRRPHLRPLRLLPRMGGRFSLLGSRPKGQVYQNQQGSGRFPTTLTIVFIRVVDERPSMPKSRRPRDQFRFRQSKGGY